MPKRKSMSKKLRFEVFKRDGFTCQYCGAKSPDVILHVDHIRPVADQGDNDLLNLVTACVDCNAGKGARKLDDRTAVVRQRVQIEELEARREQLEMMLQWRDQAEREKTDVVQEIADRIAERGGFPPNEGGRSHIRRWLKRFTVGEILAALDESFDHYMRWTGNEPEIGAWDVAFRKIPAIASLSQQAVTKPHMPKLAYIQGILRRRWNDPRLSCIPELEHILHLGGLETIEGATLLEAAAKRAADWPDLGGQFVEELIATGRHEEALQRIRRLDRGED